MRIISPLHHIPTGRFAVVAAILALAACDREITREEARADGPSLASAVSPVGELGPFRVRAINERGDIVGNGSSGPYRWTRDGGLTLLSKGTGTSAFVSDINNAGVAVGTIHLDRPGFPHRSFGVVWGLDGQPQLLPSPEGWSQMAAAAINDAGMIAGTLWLDMEGDRAFRRTPAGVMELLPYAGSDLGTAANYRDRVISINAAGDVLGSFEEYCYHETNTHVRYCYEEGQWMGAVVWPASGGMQLMAYGDHVTAYDMNDAGIAVGCADGYVAVWGPVYTEFGDRGCAHAVNSAGVVVGEARGRAFRWTAAEGMVDLGTLGAYGSGATDVNAAGEITGWGSTASGATRAFTWTEAGGMQALSLPGGATRTEGLVINDAGEVGGDAGSGSGSTATSAAARWSDTRATHPPVAHLDGPYPKRISGRRYTYSAAGSTWADTSGARYSWDMDADGRFEGVTRSPSFVYAYPAAGTHTVRLVLRDAAGRMDTATATAEVVANVAPVARVSGIPTSLAEGAVLAPAATVTDANQATDTTELGLLRYRWEWGEGGVSATKSATHRYADQGSYTIRLIVTDAGGLADTVVRALPVGNVAPTARFTSPTSIRENTPYTLTASALVDGPADVAAGLQVAFSCNGKLGAFGSALSIVCPARPDQGSVTVGMRVRDKDGAGTSTTRTIAVGNVPPQVTAEAASPTTFAAGGSFTIHGSFTDPASGDAPWRYRVYWGDGTSTALEIVPYGALITRTHTYATPGSYAVQVAVADKDGGSGRAAPVMVTVTP